MPDRRTRVALGIGAIAVLTLLVYWPALSAGYIWDDSSYVTENPLIKAADGLQRIWIPGSTAQYYPLVFTTFWIEHALWQLEPFGYHLVNVILHAINALLVWRVLTRLRVPGAWLVGAVFATHVVHVESVAWITERKNVLSGFFYLLGVLAYLRFDDPSENAEEPRDGRWGWYGATLVLFAAALLSKSVTCSLPAVLILLLLYRGRRLSGRMLLPLLPLFVLGVVAAVNTSRIEALQVGAQGPEWDFSLAERGLIATRALLFYAQKILWPWPVMFVYPRWTLDAANIMAWWRILPLLAATVACVLEWRRGHRGPFVALAFFAGTLVPALGFVNVYPHRFSFVADHFQYLASLGVLTLVIAGAVTLLRGRPRLGIAIAGTTLAALVTLSHLQARTYRDAESVWQATLRHNPDSWMPLTHMAVIRLEQAAAARSAGEVETVDRLREEARGFAARAVKLKPDDPNPRSRLAEALRQLGRPDEAIIHQEEALRMIETRYGHRPRRPYVHAEEYVRLGRIHEDLARTTRAEDAYRRAVQLQPEAVPILGELALFHHRYGQREAAEQQFQAILKQRPDSTASSILAQYAEQDQQWATASKHHQDAVRAARSPTEELAATADLVRFLATCPDPRHGDPRRAVDIANEACRRTGRQYPELLQILALAQARAGLREEAVATAEEALNLAQSLSLDAIAAEIEGQLQEYRRSPGP